MDRLGCDKGWLVIFNREKGASWEERLYVKEARVGSKTVTVYGC